MPKETVNTRVGRLERLMETLAEKQIALDDVVVTLTEAQIKTEERFQQMAARMDQLAEEDRRDREEMKRIEASLDARIAALVSAIGELVRRNGKTH